MSGSNLQSAQVQSYGFTPGSNSPMTSAHAYTQNMNAKQSGLNKVGGRRYKKMKYGKMKYGGDNGSVTVPQFPQSGPNVSPVNSNSSSIQNNTTSIATKNNAAGDHYAFENTPTTGGSRRRTMRRKSMRSKSMRSKKSKRSKKSMRSKSKRSKKSKRRM
jgi:hypothetical protein